MFSFAFCRFPRPGMSPCHFFQGPSFSGSTGRTQVLGGRKRQGWHLSACGPRGRGKGIRFLLCLGPNVFEVGWPEVAGVDRWNFRSPPNYWFQFGASREIRHMAWPFEPVDLSMYCLVPYWTSDLCVFWVQSWTISATAESSTWSLKHPETLVNIPAVSRTDDIRMLHDVTNFIS